MSEIIKEDIDRLRRLCAEATPGPWEMAALGLTWTVRGAVHSICYLFGLAQDQKRNANFIIAAREWLPKLLDEIEFQKEQIARLTAENISVALALTSDARGWRPIECPRCHGKGILSVEKHYHGDRNERWTETCSDCLGSGRMEVRPAPPADDENKT